MTIVNTPPALAFGGADGASHLARPVGAADRPQVLPSFRRSASLFETMS